MQNLPENLSISNELYNFINNICVEKNIDINQLLKSIITLTNEFSEKNSELLKKRDDLQNKVNEFFQTSEYIQVTKTINNLKAIGYIPKENENICKVNTKDIATEINPLAGPQLVVPADKANMVLNAANARWQNLFDAIYKSNLVSKDNTNEDERKEYTTRYINNLLTKVLKFKGDIIWADINTFYYDEPNNYIYGLTADGQEANITDENLNKLIGIKLNADKDLTAFLIENNGLKIEIILDDEAKIKDVFVESAVTYIIDLEDASVSAPANKYNSYNNLNGIINKTLECKVRGETRKLNSDDQYLNPKTLEPFTLKRTSFPLVREVGPHMLADESIIKIDGKAIPEKILDCFITSLIGYRYHVAPKMHGSEEVKLNVDLWKHINELQKLPANANKIGIMNEEVRTNLQLSDSISEAHEILFFTNTGFLDYTGSFIDLMMHQGPIIPYRELPTQLYKTTYEIHNVNISLELNVPQIGAGMWPAINDMDGLLKSKEQQVSGYNDTGWSPSPSAAAIHAIAFHTSDHVRKMQDEYRENIKPVNTGEQLTFPKANMHELKEEEIIENLNFAIHGLLAYAEPWVRRGVGCSGIKDLNGIVLMEDRATARIKTAFVRNWLLHKVITSKQVEESIKQMAKLVDEQNSDSKTYEILFDDELKSGKWDIVEEPVRAVYDLVFNPDKFSHSYVEPYLYPAYKREHEE